MSVEISIAEAKSDKLFYVVANLIIVKTAEHKCLLVKRGDAEKVHPGKWAFPGGKLEHKDIERLLAETGNDPLDGIDDILGKLAVRESKEESGLAVSEDSTRVIKDKLFVRPDRVPVLMTTLATEYVGGEVVLEDGFTDSAWVGLEDLPNYDCIPGIIDEATVALSL